MRDDIRLGRIAGVPVAMNWSVLVVLWLLTWVLAASVLPGVDDGLAPGVYWLVALAGAVLFLASLLAHELAHAVVAKRAGVGVEGITLWMFGGVARLEGEAPNPGADFRIAAVGPATSVAVGVGFGVLAAVLSMLGAPRITSGLLTWLGAINLLLALFNLIPGAPLDGGRILRSALWRGHGDRLRASVSAARAGRVVGFGLIALGLGEFLFGADISGLWTLFIGWFLLTAARGEEAHAVAQGALGDMRVSQVMTSAPEVAPSWLTVRAFIDDYVLRSRHSTFPVQRFDGALEGMVTLAQLKRVPPEQRDQVRVSEVATPLERVPSVRPDERLIDMLRRLSPEAGARVLVMQDGRLVGIVTPSDVARAVEYGMLRRRGTAEGSGGSQPTDVGSPMP